MAIRKVVEKTQGKNVYEMSIRQYIHWNGENSHGFVDVGDGGKSNVIATQILVYLAVCANQPWKIPLGYFPIASMGGEQKTNLTKLFLNSLFDCGVELVGVTFDGVATNLTVSKHLGSNISDTKASESMSGQTHSSPGSLLYGKACEECV